MTLRLEITPGNWKTRSYMFTHFVMLENSVVIFLSVVKI